MGEDEVATVRTLTAYREVMTALIRERRRVYRVRLEPTPPGPAPKIEKTVGRPSRRRATLLLGLVLLVVAGGVAGWSLYLRSRPPGFELPDKPSIAVLPFQNMSGD